MGLCPARPASHTPPSSALFIGMPASLIPVQFYPISPVSSMVHPEHPWKQNSPLVGCSGPSSITSPRNQCPPEWRDLETRIQELVLWGNSDVGVLTSADRKPRHPLPHLCLPLSISKPYKSGLKSCGLFSTSSSQAHHPLPFPQGLSSVMLNLCSGAQLPITGPLRNSSSRSDQFHCLGAP